MSRWVSQLCRAVLERLPSSGERSFGITARPSPSLWVSQDRTRPLLSKPSQGSGPVLPTAGISQSALKTRTFSRPREAKRERLEQEQWQENDIGLVGMMRSRGVRGHHSIFRSWRFTPTKNGVHNGGGGVRGAGSPGSAWGEPQVVGSHHHHP